MAEQEATTNKYVFASSRSRCVSVEALDKGQALTNSQNVGEADIPRPSPRIVAVLPAVHGAELSEDAVVAAIGSGTERIKTLGKDDDYKKLSESMLVHAAEATNLVKKAFYLNAAGRVLEEAGEFGSAIEQYAKARASAPNWFMRRRAIEGELRSRQQLGTLDELIEQASVVVRTETEDIGSRELLYCYYWSFAKDFHSSLGLVREMMALSPENSDMLGLAAANYRRLGMFADEAEIYERLAKSAVSPEEKCRHLNNAAYAWHKSGNSANAINMAKTLSDSLTTEGKQDYEGAAQTFFRIGQKDRAVKLLLEGEQKVSRERASALACLRALFILKQGKADEARSLCEAVIAENPPKLVALRASNILDRISVLARTREENNQ